MRAAGLSVRSHATADDRVRESRRGADRRWDISRPKDFRHNIHVGFDANTNDFTGLPSEWKQMLESSGISKEEQQKNPQVRAGQRAGARSPPTPRGRKGR